MYDIIFFVGIVALGFIFGTLNEKRHFRSIQKRESKHIGLPAVTFGKEKMSLTGDVEYKLVTANVVLSIDSFKKLIAGIINVFGGSMISYETLVDRARREALLRLKESCPNAKAIINTRIETASISKNTQNGSIGAIEVVAYGTAIF